MGNYHEWGDEDFDWKALDDAERIIRKVCKWFRIGIHSKEKYGTLRTSCFLFDGTLHSLTHPGYVYCQYPQWLWSFDCLYMHKYMNKFPFKYLVKLVQFVQLNIGYKLAYYWAMKKHPHIIEEICVDADWPEYIIGGKVIHDKYWTTYDNSN